MAKAARVLAALKRDGWVETRRSGSHRVLAKGDQQRVWAYHDGVDLGGPEPVKLNETSGGWVCLWRLLDLDGRAGLVDPDLGGQPGC
jgi:predicted RNA binding protein YcfA (HicA-like mRNA interferase family)